ncbi:MAG: hypothetical protein ACKVP0_13060 [Pirellulaceae bacterium]
MSEYQYYEFQALDRRLTEKEMDELRQISTRAEITPTSLTNEYHWGDFKGNPDKLIEKYFDLFFYFANWGTHRLILRLPKGTLKAEDIRLYETEFFGSKVHKNSVALEFRSEDESGDWIEHEESMAQSLGCIREELMAGDNRALYLGWLNAIGQDYTDVDDEDIEPPVPPGLTDLSPALTTLAEFLRIDFDLIAVAAQRSETLAPTVNDPAALKKWLAALSATQKDEWLWKVAQGEEFGLRGEMMRLFQAEKNPKKLEAKQDKTVRRTAGELRTAAEAYGEQRQQAEAAARASAEARAKKKAEAARAQRLAALKGKEETAWKRIDTWIASKESEKYDQAVDLLVDLKSLAQQNNQVQAFVNKVQEIRKQNASKQALLRRLKKAAIY